MTLEDLIDAWRVNNVVSLELLDLISEDMFDFKAGGGKSVRSHFCHIVSVRRAWAEEKMPEEASTIRKLDVKTAPASDIRSALQMSHDVIASLLTRREAGARPPKWSTPSFFGYLVAHEANHRAQIEVALRLAGREIPEAAMYKLWEWHKK